VHLRFLVTKGGTDEAVVFHKIPRIDDPRLAEIFAREVLAMLVRKELLSPEWAVRILSWRHSGFSVHSLVRAKTKRVAERVGKYRSRPLLPVRTAFWRSRLSGSVTNSVVNFGFFLLSHMGETAKRTAKKA